MFEKTGGLMNTKTSFEKELRLTCNSTTTIALLAKGASLGQIEGSDFNSQ